METDPKPDISSRLERIRARRAKQAESTTTNSTEIFPTVSPTLQFSAPLTTSPTPTNENRTDEMKLAPLPTIISTPPPPKQALKTTDIPAIRKQASPVYTGNPITHSEEKVSRLELIRKRRSRENVHSIEETVDKNEQYVDTFQHGVKPVTIADSVENPLKSVEIIIEPQKERKEEIKQITPISTPPKIPKVSFSPSPPDMFNRPTSLKEEVLAELGMTDIPPTIPESSPPGTPLETLGPGDRFQLEEEQRAPRFVSPMQAEAERDMSQKLEREKKREVEKQKRISSGSASGEDKSPGFMLIAPVKASPKKSDKSSPRHTLLTSVEESNQAITARPAERDETYSVSLSQTTTTGLLDWDLENVVDWLHFIQLQHLVPLFRERSITGLKLNSITQKELQFMGIIKSDDQQTILHEVAELRMLWQMESETGSQLMFDDITAGLANMSVRRKDLEKELDSHVTERLNKLEEIKNEQDVRINTSLSLLKEIQNPYSTEPTTQKPQQPISEQECEPIDVPQLEEQVDIVSGEDKMRFSEGLEDLAEQSLISGSSHDTEVDTEQLQPLKDPGTPLQGHIRPPTIFRTDTPIESHVSSLPRNPEKWTPSDTSQWLSSISLSQFTAFILNNRIDGKQLVSRDFTNNKDFLCFSPTEQELLLSHLQDLSPTPSTSTCPPSDPHSRQSSRAYSERIVPPPRPMKDARSASDTGLLDHIIETTAKEKQGKKGFFRKLIPKKFSSEKLDKSGSTPEMFPKFYSSEGELASMRSAKKLAGFFGVETQSPAIQSLFHTRDKEGQGMLRIYVTHVLPDVTYKAVLVHPKDNCLHVLRLVMQKGGLQKEDINRFSLIESCPSNPRVAERELGLHEYPLIIHMRHLDMPEPFHFELRTRPSTSLQFVINVPDKLMAHTLRIQIASNTTARECIRLFKGRIPELDDPTLKLVVETEREDGELSRLRDHDTPVMLYSDWTEEGEHMLFSISREAPVANEQRTTRELLDEIQDLESAVRSYCIVEQKYTTLQEEYQKILRKSRDSASSARDISSIDQLQELDVKYQFKTQLCREQKDEIKGLKSKNEELLGKLVYLKSETSDSQYPGDPELSQLKLKLTEKKKEVNINDDVQSLTEENTYLKDELRKKQLIVDELEATGRKNGSKKGPNGVDLFPLVIEHPDYAFVGAHLDINKTGPALGISIGKRNEPGTFVMKIIPGSVADKDGSLRIGDRLIEVNGIDISHLEHSAIVSLFKSVTTSVKIVVARKTERDQLAQQKLAQKVESYDNLREKYQTLEAQIEEINKLKEIITQKETEISDLKRQVKSKIILEENEHTALEAEYTYTRGYLDQLLTVLERDAPQILERLPQEFDPIPEISESDEPINDEEWC